jgi:hypothetical protein
MEAILKFNLPEEQVEFNLAVNGSSWSHVVWKVSEELRRRIKYDPNLTEEQSDAYQEVRDMIQGFMDEQNIDWDL